MASVLDSVKHYQHSIEKYPNDEQKILKCIDKLYNLAVTVQHLQETGVGRTVNALRKEPGDVGQAARALVYKWKTMVAAEESDQEDNKNDTTNYNGHENGKCYENDSSESRSKHNKPEKSHKTPKIEEKQHKHTNGDYGSKRKYQSSEEEESETKKMRYSSTSDNGYKIKSETKIKREPSESEMDSQDDSSQSESESDSQSSEEERKPEIRVIKETVPKTENQSTKKHSSSSSRDKYKHDSHSENMKHSLEKHEKHHRSSTSEAKHSSDKLSSKEKTHSSHTHRSSKGSENSSERKEREHRSHESDKKHKSESSSKHSDKHRSSQSSEKQKTSSSVDKHRSSSNSEKQRSSDEKHRSSSNSEKHKPSSSSEKSKSNTAEKHKHHSEKHSSSRSDKEKHKQSSEKSSEKEISSDKHKTKESNSSSSSSSKDKQSSSNKETSKDKSSSSKTKEHSQKSDKNHSSSKDAKNSDDKRQSESSKKSKHKSSSTKSSSSKPKDDEPKKKEGGDSDDGIDCGSGASFAEALGMISPAKPKKKSAFMKDSSSPNSNDDMSPAALLAPTTKLTPLPALEISALPEISPNYRPRPPPKFLPHFTDEDAMNAGISSKNQRTKVYSGNKVIGKITTLYEMCVHILQEHIDSLEYTGGVPYDILKPVVDRATPQQLFVLEHYNPYLMDDTDHLWQKFCEKNFRNKKRQEMETWREMYMRCQEEQEIKLKSLTANIKIAQEAKKAPIKQTKMAYVDSVVKPPRNIAKKQAQHGTAFAATASPAARVASLAAAPNVLKGGRPTPVPTVSTSSFKPKKAPLMQKALQFLRGRKR